MSAILPAGSFEQKVGAQPAINLSALMSQLAIPLQPKERAAFFSMAQPMTTDRALLANITLVEAAVVLIILALIAALLIASANKSSQEMGRELDKKVRRLRGKVERRTRAVVSDIRRFSSGSQGNRTCACQAGPR